MARPSRFVPIPALLRGSLVTLRRKCGKPTCRCARQERHETPVLSYSLGGSTKILALRAQDVPQVKAALKRYRDQARALDRQAIDGIRRLTQRIQNARAQALKARR